LSWARFYLAKIHFDLGRYEKARKELQLGLQGQARPAPFLALLGEVERKLGHPEQALELEARALQADSTLTPADYYRPPALLDLRRPDEARPALETAVASPYVTPEVFIALASLLVEAHDLSRADELCRKAIALDPSRPEGHLKLAEVLRLKRAYDGALAEL